MQGNHLGFQRIHLRWMRSACITTPTTSVAKTGAAPAARRFIWLICKLAMAMIIPLGPHFGIIGGESACFEHKASRFLPK